MDISATERKELAERLGLNEQYLYQCFTGRASMDPKEAVRVEAESKKRITRQMVRVHDWRDVWPELARQISSKPSKLKKAA